MRAGAVDRLAAALSQALGGQKGLGGGGDHIDEGVADGDDIVSGGHRGDNSASGESVSGFAARTRYQKEGVPFSGRAPALKRPKALASDRACFRFYSPCP